MGLKLTVTQKKKKKKSSYCKNMYFMLGCSMSQRFKTHEYMYINSPVSDFNRNVLGITLQERCGLKKQSSVERNRFLRQRENIH